MKEFNRKGYVVLLYGPPGDDRQSLIDKFNNEFYFDYHIKYRDPRHMDWSQSSVYEKAVSDDYQSISVFPRESNILVEGLAFPDIWAWRYMNNLYRKPTVLEVNLEQKLVDRFKVLKFGAIPKLWYSYRESLQEQTGVPTDNLNIDIMYSFYRYFSPIPEANERSLIRATTERNRIL